MNGLGHLEPGVFEVDSSDVRVARFRRNVLTSVRLADQLPDQVEGKRDRWAMLTTTYRDDAEWERRHISRLVKCARRHIETAGYVFRYVWVLEMTKRGRPHYHMAIKLPAGVKLPKPDEAGWWPHGSTRIEYARYVGAYIAKYCSKTDSFCHYPRGARISGFGGLTQEAKRERRWWASPSYVREEFGEDANPFRAPGGGWVDRETGEIMAARYQMVGRRGKVIRLRDLWETKQRSQEQLSPAERDTMGANRIAASEFRRQLDRDRHGMIVARQLAHDG